jgi:hypothetical protein
VEESRYLQDDVAVADADVKTDALEEEDNGAIDEGPMYEANYPELIMTLQ